MIALDASVLVAHFHPSDAHHRAATTLLREAADQALVAHTLIVAEVLVGGVRIGRQEEMLADLQAIGVQIAAPIADEPLRLARLRAETRLRMPDCCVLDTALRDGGSLATFDDALIAAARELDVAVVP